MKLTKYGLLNTNGYSIDRMVGFLTRINPDGIGIQYELYTHGTGVWLVDTKEEAEYVKNNSTICYKSDYTHPTNDLVRLKVVKVTLKIEEV